MSASIDSAPSVQPAPAPTDATPTAPSTTAPDTQTVAPETPKFPTYPGERAETDMGWPGDQKWPYTILPRAAFDTEFARVARTQSFLDGRADGVLFQPDPVRKNQDRLVVHGWDMPGGQWTFAAVFDGPYGCACRQRDADRCGQATAPATSAWTTPSSPSRARCRRGSPRRSPRARRRPTLRPPCLPY
jgi:hypothetical protein